MVLAKKDFIAIQNPWTPQGYYDFYFDEIKEKDYERLSFHLYNYLSDEQNYDCERIDFANDVQDMRDYCKYLEACIGADAVSEVFSIFAHC